MFTLTAGLIIETKELRDELRAALKDVPVRVLFEEASFGEPSAFKERLGRTEADVVIIDVAAAGSVEEWVSAIRSAKHKPAVIVADSEPDQGMILRALRAGASEYLFPPVQDPLKAALGRIASERGEIARSESRPTAKAIGLLGSKGGCGVTSISCHVAVDIPARTKQKLLVVDCDFESGMVSFLLKSRSGYSVSDVAANIHRLDESYWRAVVSNGKPGVEVLSAPETPAGRNVQAQNLPAILSFARTQYDWVLVDMGRSVTAKNLVLAECLDKLYVVTTADLTSLHQTKTLLTLLSEVGLSRERVEVVLNRMPKSLDVSVEELERMLGATICITIPDYPGAVDEAIANNRLLEPGSGLGRHFSRLAAKMCGQEAEPPVKKWFGFF